MFTHIKVRLNWLLVADTQPKNAASRRVLRASQRQRYASWPAMHWTSMRLRRIVT